MTYTAIFFRYNPQLQKGGYETTRTIEARTEASALKKAKKIENSCVYGCMTLRSIKKEQ